MKWHAYISQSNDSSKSTAVTASTHLHYAHVRGPYCKVTGILGAWKDMAAPPGQLIALKIFNTLKETPGIQTELTTIVLWDGTIAQRCSTVRAHGTGRGIVRAVRPSHWTRIAIPTVHAVQEVSRFANWKIMTDVWSYTLIFNWKFSSLLFGWFLHQWNVLSLCVWDIYIPFAWMGHNVFLYIRHIVLSSFDPWFAGHIVHIES